MSRGCTPPLLTLCMLIDAAEDEGCNASVFFSESIAECCDESCKVRTAAKRLHAYTIRQQGTLSYDNEYGRTHYSFSIHITAWYTAAHDTHCAAASALQSAMGRTLALRWCGGIPVLTSRRQRAASQRSTPGQGKE